MSVYFERRGSSAKLAVYYEDVYRGLETTRTTQRCRWISMRPPARESLPTTA